MELEFPRFRTYMLWYFISDSIRLAYFFFQLKYVPWLIPCFRHKSAVFAPAWRSCRIPMICSSVNRDLFVVRLLSRGKD